jgi:16S rRNA (cytosine1402-N4)-methyltransferase
MTNTHIPVLMNEVIEKIWQKNLDSKIYIDGTFGGGGYTNLLDTISNNQAQITTCDLDSLVFDNFLEHNQINNQNIKFINANFSDLVEDFSDGSVAGMMLDLGFNSNQLIVSNRGFSYLQKDDVLDLRYDISQGMPLWQKLIKLKNDSVLRDIIYQYSGEELSARIARVVYNYLGDGQVIYKVNDLVNVVSSAIPAKFQKKQYSILSRVWQALRIWTNDEFASLEKFLQIAPSKLIKGGRIAIVCFHSLEDKIVTKQMRNLAKPVLVDEFGNKVEYFKFLTPKAILPTKEEIETNPRSRSATLRILEKL